MEEDAWRGCCWPDTLTHLTEQNERDNAERKGVPPSEKGVPPSSCKSLILVDASTALEGPACMPASPLDSELSDPISC